MDQSVRWKPEITNIPCYLLISCMCQTCSGSLNGEEWIWQDINAVNNLRKLHCQGYTSFRSHK